jgi:hypothetical protein
MEEQRKNQKQDQDQQQSQEGGQLSGNQSFGGVGTANTREDVSNPINSGGEPTIDTENRAAVAQTRSPSQRSTGMGSKTFITGSDSDGQV